VKPGLVYGLLAARRRAGALVLPAATVATGAFLLVLVIALMPAVRDQAYGDVSGAAVVISVIVLLVGALEVAIAATRSVVQRTREIGVLCSFGVPRRAIMWGLMVEPVATACAGAVAGALLAALAAPVAAAAGWVAVSVDPGTVAWAVLAAVGVSTLTAAAAGALPTWRAARRPPLVSLTD
jgi:ABC-type antimicrobial peptide transport system permease subunit